MNRYGLGFDYVNRSFSIRCGQHREVIDARTIRTYIPDAVRLPHSGSSLDMDHYISESRPVKQRVVPFGIMQKACQEFLSILAENYTDGQQAHLALTEWLAMMMLTDRQRAHSDPLRYPRTLAIFICLADISKEFASPRIATVLHHFFSKHGGSVLLVEKPRAVFLWGWAIMISKLSEAEQFTCLQEIMHTRPDVVLDERYYYAANLPDIGKFYRAISSIANNDGRPEWNQRGRTRLREFEMRRALRENRSRSRPLRLTPLRDNQPVDVEIYERRIGPVGSHGSAARSALEKIQDEQHELRNEIQELTHEVRKLRRQGRQDRNLEEGWVEVDEYIDSGACWGEDEWGLNLEW